MDVELEQEKGYYSVERSVALSALNLARLKDQLMVAMTGNRLAD